VTPGNGDQNLAAQAGEAAAAAGAHPLGPGNEVAGAGIVVMVGGQKAARAGLAVHSATM